MHIENSIFVENARNVRSDAVIVIFISEQCLRNVIQESYNHLNEYT